jgi:methyltransferase-like protein
MDFVRNRMFRQTLLCHDHLRPNLSLRPEQLTAFHVASPLRPVKELPNIASTEPEEFEAPSGIRLSSRDPLVKAAVVHLAGRWPHAVPFTSLRDTARSRLSGSGKADAAQVATDTQVLGQALLTFYASASTSLVELSLCPPRLPEAISERPTASSLARVQAASKSWVTNLRHEQVWLGEFERQLLRLLDGNRDLAVLLPALAELVEQGELTVEEQGQAVRETGRLTELLGQAIERQLPLFQRNALLTVGGNGIKEG